MCGCDGLNSSSDQKDETVLHEEMCPSGATTGLRASCPRIVCCGNVGLIPVPLSKEWNTVAFPLNYPTPLKGFPDGFQRSPITADTPGGTGALAEGGSGDA